MALVDIERFDVPTEDFLGFVVAKAERAAKIAYGLYEEACRTRDPVRIQIAMRNCNDAAKHAREVHEKFLELSEHARSVIPIDRASHIYGLELESLRQLLTGMGLRLGPVANPQDPERAQRVIDAEIDRVFGRMAVPIDLRAHIDAGDPPAAA